MSDTANPAQIVRHFRQILTWPVQLTGQGRTPQSPPFWAILGQNPGKAGWHLVEDEFVSNPEEFQERHYKEFVVFLPHVQRFLYGEGRGRFTHDADDHPANSALKVYRRDDVAQIRVVLRPGMAPILLTVQHIDLCFFDDVDIAFLIVEVYADNLPLPTVIDLLYRTGRVYPTGWNDGGQGVHNACSVEWLGRDGRVLVASNAADRDHYLAFTCEHRAPPVSAHWAYLMEPMALDTAPEPADIRFRHIEHHRMPLMAYLAMDNSRSLTHEQWCRLGLTTTLHPDDPLPIHDPDITEFHARYCYDRYWSDTEAGPNTRFLCSGRTFVIVGEENAAYFSDTERGILAQFRHQYFILFLINQFHHAALLMFSDKLSNAIHDLDIRAPLSVRRFRRRIRESFETFLRFTHRYWFHELSERPHMQALSHLCSKHLRNDRLYTEVKDEMGDMNDYLDSDSTRRTNNLFMRLTVVTVFSIIGTVATGFFGMNVFNFIEDQSMTERVIGFFGGLAGVTLILMIAVFYSRQLSEMMDVLSEGPKPLGSRLRSMFWRKP